MFFFVGNFFYLLQIKIRIMNPQQSNSSQGNSSHAQGPNNNNNNIQQAIEDITHNIQRWQQQYRQRLGYLADPQGSWYNDPAITDDARRIRERARNYRQYLAYLRDPVNFNRQEWRREDEARMIAMYPNPHNPVHNWDQHHNLDQQQPPMIYHNGDQPQFP